MQYNDQADQNTAIKYSDINLCKSVEIIAKGLQVTLYVITLT